MVYKLVYIISTLIVIIGSLFKIQHWTNANLILTIGGILTFFYAIIGVLEIYNSNKLTERNKVIWMLSFLFFSGITGFIYMFKRKNIAE